MPASITPVLRRTLAMATATAALATGTALGAASTAGAAAPRASASCGDVWIGDHAQYMYQGVSAGWVDQYWDSCNDRVGAYWTWDPTFQAQNQSATVTLYVSTPYGPLLQQVATDTASQGNTGADSEWAHGDTPIDQPDAWRAGAEINHSGCVEWGWLHWYNGTNLDGARGGCNDPYAPNSRGNQPGD
ncbi:hypothetical protein ABH926_006161 [Catenulispora sp. GP43]|uniref:hypothetical protein n=1 Tax=Catenulispora sp. GP43 TaxID=3156263 RepID=UPI003516BB20